MLGLLLALLVVPQSLPPVPLPPPTVALYVNPNVVVYDELAPKVNVMQQTQGAVNNCKLTKAEASKMRCLTIYVRDRETHAPLRNVRVITAIMDDYDFSNMKHSRTGAGGFVNLKVPLWADLFFSIYTPNGYGARKVGQFHELKDAHTVAIWEISKVQ